MGEARFGRNYIRSNLPGEYVNCRNPRCYNGGFSLGSILRDMVRNRETEREAYELCQGNEASPDGRRVYRKCFNRFKVKVAIAYADY